ncbi:MAG: AraC family transcriptional regulator [Armatimonadetes bacterium]|nr:AraC family transcriptional regulator [Armatimonadota bacterium]
MPPKESSAAEYHYHKILATVIEEVLRRKSGRVRVPELAAVAGFSRFHLTRLFNYTAGETLEQFLRRIRLERSAYLLLHTNQRITQIAKESGYRSPEAFSRAFKRTFGCLPTEAKNRLDNWELASASDLHWNADWVLGNRQPDLDIHTVELPTRYAHVWRAVGDYAKLPESWERLKALQGPGMPTTGTFITIYRDNLWTHPVCRTMRADLGWLCDPDDAPPSGMRKTMLPAGRYASTRFVDRSERTEAWSSMWGQYSLSGTDWICYDEYSDFPLPFDDVKTRLLVSHP